VDDKEIVIVNTINDNEVDKIDIKSLELPELTELIKELGDKPFRAGQLYDWMHVKLAQSFEDMSNISKSLKASLADRCDYTSIEQIRLQESKEDGTKKYLFKLHDGHTVETVWMKYKHGNSVCISSQVGCRMGCKFCASTLDGLARNLKASEMLEQIYAVTRETGERVSNIVVMGTGEPMDNFDNIVRFIKLISSDKGLNISQRNITVSTCGIVPKMREFADQGFAVTLALSLHATTDEKRKTIMPVANSYSIEELMDACKYYFDKTGRRITFEYSLIGGVNDSVEEANALAGLAGPLRAHINLIPVNPVVERGFKESDRTAIEAFKNKLEKKQINVTIRREMGRDIDGACGQLRRRYINE